MTEDLQILDNENIFQRQSLVINAMRFVLIILVLFIHMMPPDAVAVNLSFSDAGSFYRFVTEMISHNLGEIAVPAFFLFSGYFFFNSAEKTPYDLKWFSSKWKKRIKSILIPYLAWNALNIIVIVGKNLSLSMVGVAYDELFISLRSMDFFRWFWLDPIDFPLWYLRDLICMITISPLFYWGYKAFGGGLVIILFAFFISNIVIPIPGFSTSAVCFFGAGACLGLSKSVLLGIARKVKLLSLFLALFLLVAGTLTSGYAINSIIKKLFIPTGIFAMINVIDLLSFNSIEKLASLSVMVFFIYASHTIYLISWGNGLFMRLFHGSLSGWTIRYFTEPFIILAICIFLYLILKRIMPKTLTVLCGGRS